MKVNIAPSKQGQICKAVNPLPGEHETEAYIITEDVSVYHYDEIIYVASITDLHRNINNPLLAPRKAIKKSELRVVANDLMSYVASWNN